MKKYDFAIIYEVKNREFETVCLLKYELERRGYSVYVVETWQWANSVFEPVCADVVLTFALYRNGQLRYAFKFIRNAKAIINMQWEQIYSNSDITQEKTIYRVCDKALEGYHVSWGRNNTQWLVERCGLPEENLIRAGHPAMDFTKPRFAGYYLDRSVLLDHYGIKKESKIVLFVSSFSYVGLPEVLLNSQDLGVLPELQHQISVLSQQGVLEWLEKAASSHTECTFIYRPHPAEANNKKLKQIEENILNFKVIGEHSIKQWIYIADKVYTWYSTAVADAYYSGKSFSILRPIEVPEKMELTIYNKADFIKSYEEFEHSLISSNLEIPITQDVFNEYYYYDKDEYTYEIICDKCEELLKSAKNKEESAFREFEPSIVPFYKKIYRRFKEAVWSFLLEINNHAVLKCFLKCFDYEFQKKIEYREYIKQSAQKHGFMDTEIEETIKHIENTISRNADPLE